MDLTTEIERIKVLVETIDLLRQAPGIDYDNRAQYRGGAYLTIIEASTAIRHQCDVIEYRVEQARKHWNGEEEEDA